MNPISAIIVVKDNPPHAIETIESIDGFVKEIIVADIGMDKDLRSKINSYNGVKIVDIQEAVPYVELIREKLKKQASEEYVLFLDPDEILTIELKKIIELYIDKCDFFSIPRKNIIFGKWIQHSRWWPDYQVRLFRKNTIVWPQEIHKQPITTGKEYKIEPKAELSILHHNYESIDEYLTKAMRYAKSEADEYITKKKEVTLGDAMKKAVSEFISRFFADHGYKDGIHGFILAIFQMFYPLLVYFYFLEKIKFDSRLNENELLQETTHFFGRLHKESIFWKNKHTPGSVREKIIEKLTE